MLYVLLLNTMAESEELFRKLRCFNCYGRTQCKDSEFNPDSFLRSGELNILSEGVKNVRYHVPKDISLFERNYDEGSAVYHLKVLFRLARKELKTLEDAVNLCVVNKDQNSGDLAEKECEELRKHVLELLNYIRIYFLSIPIEMKASYHRLKAEFLTEMSSFYCCLPRFTLYADLYVQLSSRKDSYCLYHMYHLILDVHWYYISLLVILKNYANFLNDLHDIDSEFPLESERVKETGVLEKQIQVLLSELLSVAVARIKKIKTGDPHEETPFVCKCVEEVWVLLQNLSDSLADARAGKSFWSHVNFLLDGIVTEMPKVSNENHSDRMEVAKCGDPTAFSLWFILHLSFLYGYNQQGEFVGQKSGRAKNNYSQMEKSLLTFISQNSLPGSDSKIELQMRRYIEMSSIICLERWWKPMKSEVVMIFWEYFQRRLNTSFLLPGSSLASLPQISKFALGMLVRVKKRIAEEGRSENEEDSFCMFLKFLGRYLTHCRKEGSTSEGNGFRLWQQIRGRIYSKLGPAKVKGLSQLGLYRLISLFLTLSITADIKEVGKKMLDVIYLLSPWDPSGRDIAKRELVWQAHICLLCLHIQHEIDIAEITKPLLIEVQAACNELCAVSKLNSATVFSDSWKLATAHSEGLRRLLSLFIEGINEVVGSSLRLCLSEYSLIGPWISNWLKVCSSAATCRLMDAILTILEKLQTLRESISQANEHIADLWEGNAVSEMVEDGEGTIQMKQQWEKMESALLENVLPMVQSLCLEVDPPFQVADIAAYFTLNSFSSNSENFPLLFTFFAASDAVNYRISRRYMCHLLQNEKFMKALSLNLIDYQDVIIQVWVRSCLLSLEESNIGELEDLTRIVIKLKKMTYTLNTQPNSTSDQIRSIVSFEEFLKVVAENYDSYQTVFEKSKFREQCSVYFSKVDKVIGPHVRSPSSQVIVMSIYHACGLMVLHCGNIIYTKGKPNCVLPSIIAQLILPTHIYNPEPKLHKYILTAIKRTLIMYARGLAKLSPNTDQFIKRCLRELVTHYLPCLYEKNQTFPSSPHPLLVSFDNSSPENEILQTTILEILSTVFLTSKGKQPHVHASKAIDLLQDILEIGRRKSKAYEQGEELVRQIATRSLPGLLEFLLGVEEGLEECTKALNLINLIVLTLQEVCKSGNLINEIIEGSNKDRVSGDFSMEEVGNSREEKSEQWREIICSAAQKFFQQHMAFSASAVFRVMQNLIPVNPNIANASIGDLEEEVKKVELRRGTGYDLRLRNSLERIRSLLEAALKTNKSAKYPRNI